MRKGRLISIALVLALAFLFTQISFAAPKNFALKFDGKKDDGETGTRIIVDHSERIEPCKQANARSMDLRHRL